MVQILACSVFTYVVLLTLYIIDSIHRMSRYLFDPTGRSLTVKNIKKDNTVVWRCTVRPKKDPCPKLHKMLVCCYRYYLLHNQAVAVNLINAKNTKI